MFSGLTAWHWLTSWCALPGEGSPPISASLVACSSLWRAWYLADTWHLPKEGDGDGDRDAGVDKNLPITSFSGFRVLFFSSLPQLQSSPFPGHAPVWKLTSWEVAKDPAMGQACWERACSVSWQTGSVGDDDRQKWGDQVMECCAAGIFYNLFLPSLPRAPQIPSVTWQDCTCVRKGECLLFVGWKCFASSHVWLCLLRPVYKHQRTKCQRNLGPSRGLGEDRVGWGAYVLHINPAGLELLRRDAGYGSPQSVLA